MPALPNDLVPLLVDWYRDVARELPWRSDPTPYRVLLSELMCQQTRVETALPYFERFVALWPTVQDLAAATEDEVVHAWAGLGYYSRARSLHACAVAASASGGIPSTVDALRALPGVGPYTAGAIASIAFGRKAAAVDGNVERVLSRLDRAPEAPWSAAGKRALWERARDLHGGLRAADHPGELNQGLMELGARVCTPRSPTCSACPLAGHCAARAHGDVADWPRTRPRKAPTPVTAVVAIVEDGDTILMGRRPAEGLLAGLWEPVMASVESPELATRQGLAAGLLLRTGLHIDVGACLGQVVHVFSHRRLTAVVFAARALPHAPVVPVPSADPPYAALQWSRDPEALALSTLARKLLALHQAPPLFLAADGPLQPE